MRTRIFVVGVLLPALALHGQSVSVERKIRISAMEPGIENAEVMIAADPSNPNHLLACGMAHLPQTTPLVNSQTRVFVSFDRGHTWTMSLTLHATGWVADPSCILGSNGVAFSAALVFEIDDRSFKGKTVLYGSVDGGKTWSLRSTFPEEGDREFLTLDEASGRLYLIEKLVGRRLDGRPTVPITLYDSGDAGRAFNTLGVFVNSDSHVMPGSPGGVLPDGTYVNAIAETPLNLDSAQDDEATITRRSGTIRVLLYNRDHRPDTIIVGVSDFQPCNPVLNSSAIPSVAVDRYSKAFAGRIYVAWPDSRFGNCKILVSFSADAGRTWSIPLPVTDGQLPARHNRGSDQFHPALAVNVNGVVGLFWGERPNTQGRSWHPTFSASTDGGQTFVSRISLDEDAETKHSDPDRLKLQARVSGAGTPTWHALFLAPSKPTFHIAIQQPPFSIAGGETDGLTADSDGVFHAVWVESGVLDAQIWTTRISVDGKGTRNAVDDLSRLKDVSADVRVFFSDLTFDKSNSTLHGDMYVQNISQSTLTRLVLRVLSLSSTVGEPTFMNADNNRNRSGAIFDLTSLLPDKKLLPGQTISPKKVLIQLSGSLPDMPIETDPASSGLVSFEAVVLGTKSGS